MLSVKRLQNAVNEIRQITGLHAALFNTQGKCICMTSNLPAATGGEIITFLSSDREISDPGRILLFRIRVEEETEYVLCLQKGENAEMLGRMAVCQIRNLLIGSRDQQDRSHFMQSVLMREMLPAEIQSRAQKFHIEQKKRVVYVVDSEGRDTDLLLELIRNLSDVRAGDYVGQPDEKHVVMIRDISSVREKDLEQKMQEQARTLLDMISAEAMIRVRIGYSVPRDRLEQLADSYQEAVMALEIGQVFYPERLTVTYSRLGIGRLINQLPKDLCETFITEVFGNHVPEILEDEESMSTIKRFFDNNLNISETARQLYVHRNTLVYRLERIQKAIGLDIRNFDEAITFRIAVMVLSHLKDIK